MLMLHIAVFSFGQGSKVTADTFYFSGQAFSGKRLIIRSDSTFYLREIGCTRSNITTGFWTKTKDTYSLTSLVLTFAEDE